MKFLNQLLTKKWYVAYTYPKCEKKAFQSLQTRGVETFLPLQKVKKKWSDRIKLVEQPLFPNYIFVKTNESSLFKLIGHSFKITRFINFGQKYATISDSQIELIRRLIKEKGDVNVVSNSSFEEGEKVTVRFGCFEGLEGTIVRNGGDENLFIEFESFNQNILVRMPCKYLKVS